MDEQNHPVPIIPTSEGYDLLATHWENHSVLPWTDSCAPELWTDHNILEVAQHLQDVRGLPDTTHHTSLPSDPSSVYSRYVAGVPVCTDATMKWFDVGHPPQIAPSAASFPCGGEFIGQMFDPDHVGQAENPPALSSGTSYAINTSANPTHSGNAPACHSSKNMDAAELEGHKSELRYLFLVLNRPLKTIREHMEATYGIQLSETQYKRLFAKWKFRKNVKEKEWKHINHKIQKRKGDGKETVVFLDDVLVPPAKVLKETARHSWCNIRERLTTRTSGSSPKTPEGILVCSPRAENRITDIETLPWFQISDYQKVLFDSLVSAQDIRRLIQFGADPALPLIPRCTPDPPFKLSSRLYALLPERFEGEVRDRMMRVLGQNEGSSRAEILNLCLFSIANNHLTRPIMTHILEGLSSPARRRSIFELFSHGGTYVEAFAESLFKKSLETDSLELVRDFLRNGADANISMFGTSALAYCAYCGWFETCRALVEAGADVNATSSGFCIGTPLQAAMRYYNTELVRLLLNHGADPNRFAGDTEQLSPLQEALLTLGLGSTTIVQLLLDAGADVNAQSNDELPPIELAVAYGTIETIQMLLHAGAGSSWARMDDLGRSLLRVVSATGNAGMLEALWLAGDEYEQADDQSDSEDEPVPLCGHTAVREILREAKDARLGSLVYEIALAIAPGTARQARSAAIDDAIDDGNLDALHFLLTTLKATDGHRTRYACVHRPDLDAGGCNHFMCLLEAAAELSHDSVQKCFKLVLSRTISKADDQAFKAKLDAYARYTMSSDRHELAIALCAAIEASETHLMEGLIMAGANVNTPAALAGGTTALHEAVYSGDSDAVIYLLSNGADVNARAEDGTTILQAAVQQDFWCAKKPTAIKHLISSGADVNAAPGGAEHLTAIGYAVQHRCVASIRALICAGANVHSQLSRIRHLVLQMKPSWDKDDADLIKLLVGYDLSVAMTDLGASVLHDAVKKGDQATVQLLVGAGADINRPRRTLLEEEYRSLLGTAVSSGHSMIIDFLLAAGANVNAPIIGKYGSTALQEAAKRGDIGIVQSLLLAGADVNALPAEIQGKTALQAAAAEGHIEVVKALINAGGNLNAPPARERGRTALQAATGAGNRDLVVMLIEAGADVNQAPAPDGGVTALQLAAIEGYLGLATILLDADADIDAEAAPLNGRTALEGAAEYGRLDMVKLLLDSGVETSGKGHAQYLRALEFATNNGYLVVAKMLRSHCHGTGS